MATPPDAQLDRFAAAALANEQEKALMSGDATALEKLGRVYDRTEAYGNYLAVTVYSMTTTAFWALVKNRPTYSGGIPC